MSPLNLSMLKKVCSDCVNIKFYSENQQPLFSPPRDTSGASSASGSSSNPATPFPLPMVRLGHLHPNFHWNRNFWTGENTAYSAPNIVDVDGHHLAIPCYNPLHPTSSHHAEILRARVRMQQDFENQIGYQCPICPKTFSSRFSQASIAHYNQHCGIEFHCPYCKFRGFHPQYLKVHLLRCKQKKVNELLEKYRRDYLENLVSSSAQNDSPLDLSSGSSSVESTAEI